MYAAGPVFIGSGKEIGKKEYVFLNRRQVGVLDPQKFYQEMSARKKERQFEDYLLGRSRDDLTGWLGKQKIKLNEIRPFVRYTLDCSDAAMEQGANFQIWECMKDAYGCPYVPGSSLKGMLRTILLSESIIRSPARYQDSKATLKRNASMKASRNSYLNQDILGIEGTAFRTLQREGTRSHDAVNDRLQGFIVSDSEPLPMSSLVLCQRVELHTDGTEKTLPLLRECIKPGTEIRFTITVDTQICNISIKVLMNAVKDFMDCYYRQFSSAFPGIAPPKENEALLGGGCGFAAKTIIYPLYGKREGMEITQRIFDTTLGRLSRTHKHDKDRQLGASPHILKCTKYQGKTVQMGLCRIRKITPAHPFSHAP